ncbi:EpsG family protein [Mediterraneibacter faecis]|uniref:EpsG family protein n=1 Tax=Mediterraneibacter faecis TaxID=592978 RepID=UPI003D067261
MTPFVIGFFIISISALCCRYGINKENNKKIFLGISFLILFVLMGVRSPLMGTDSTMYNNIFMRVGQQSSLKNALDVSGISAPGYVLFCRVAYVFFQNYQARILGTSFIILVGVFRYIKKSSNNIYLSVMLFITLTFYVQSYNISRQYMAVAILLNAFVEWYENKKSILGWILFIIAISFHTTAIVGIAVWFLIDNKIDYNNKKEIRKLILKSTVLGIIVIASQTQLLNLFLQLFPVYGNYFGGKALNQFNDQGQGRTIIIIFGYLAMVIYCFILLGKKRECNNERNLAGEQLPIMLFAVIIGILGASYPTVLRMNIFFTITAITFIPNTLALARSSNKRILTWVTLFLTFIFLVIYMIEDKSDVIPYIFFWN